MAKPEKEAKRTVAKGSGRKGSGGKKSESPVGSGEGVAPARASAEDPKRNAIASAIGALYPAGEVPIPVASELAKVGSLDDLISQEQVSLPFYGNYCGRGHDDPTGKTPPVDAVDAVCRQHNRCYRLLGDFDSRCDRDLIESMPNAIAITPSPTGKNAGLLALLYFSLAERNLALGETLLKRPSDNSGRGPL